MRAGGPEKQPALTTAAVMSAPGMNPSQVRRAVLDLANTRVRVTCPDGRRRTVSLFEARLMELASPRCSRRLMCQDFIALVRMAVQIPPDVSNSGIPS